MFNIYLDIHENTPSARLPNTPLAQKLFLAPSVVTVDTFTVVANDLKSPKDCNKQFFYLIPKQICFITFKEIFNV
jgi:hypothetical protein